ncbi:mechanosensitive ion channel family protein [Dokdonia sp.]|uniref:mechanosensitive ion channel family protein n=1 Tax=Dokdonia sp. TaxID=2024995 RepID=UPI003263CB67
MTFDNLSKILTLKGGILIAIFVILFILIGLLIKKRVQKNKPVIAPRIMRYLLLPTTFVFILCVYILGLSRTTIIAKFTETILVIFGIAFLLNMISHLFFSEGNIITGKETIPKLARNIIQFLLVVFASAFVLSHIWRFDLGNLLTGLGVSSFVIGLALQEPLGNLFNGIALLAAKPFEKGDWLEIGNETGQVVDFSWSSVKIVNRFNELIIIPNNALAKEHIKNLSRPSPVHAELVTVGFSYDDDPIKVKNILLEVAASTEHILKTPEPASLLISYKDFYINYGLKFYIKDYADQILLKDQIMTRIYAITKKRGLTIPYPIQDVHIKTQS